MTPAEAAQTIATLIASYRFRYTSEAELQSAILGMLEQAGWVVRREAKLDSSSRIDFLCAKHPNRLTQWVLDNPQELIASVPWSAICDDGSPPPLIPGMKALEDQPIVGIECKVAGTPSAVARQVERYLALPQIDALVLVSNRHRHTTAFRPQDGLSKPVRFLCIARAC